jgi:hypothetical protein
MFYDAYGDYTRQNILYWVGKAIMDNLNNKHQNFVIKSKMQFLPLLAFGIAILLHVIWIDLLVLPSSAPDELASMSSAAYLAGYDWSQILSSQNSYYGYGSAWFLAPVFMFVKNPITVYYIMRLVGGVIASIPTLLAYKILTKHFHVTNIPFVFVGSIVCSLFALNTSHSFTNEPMLFLFTWLVFYTIILLQTANSEKQKRGYSILAAIVLAYTLTLHTRAILFYILFAIVVVLFAVYTKKILIDPLDFIFASVMGIGLISNFTNQVQKNIFGQNGVLHNSISDLSSQAYSAIPSIVNHYGIRNSAKGFLDLFASNSLGIIVFSAGLLIVACWQFLFQWHDITVKRIKEKSTNFSQNIFFPVAYCMFGLVLSIAAHCVLNIYHGAYLNAEGNIPGDGRFFFYLRYYIYFSAPALLFLMVTIFQNWQQKQLKRVFIYSLITIIFFFVYFICRFVYFSTQHSVKAFDVATLFSSLTFNVSVESFRFTHYIIAIFIVIVIFISIFLLIKHRRPVIALLIVGALMFYQNSFEMLVFRKPFSNDFYTYSNAIYELYCENPELKETVDQWYVNSNETYRLCAVVQLLLPDMKIYNGYPQFTQNEENFAILSDSQLFLDYYGDIYTGKLDDYAILYVKGQKYIEAFEDSGVTLEPISFPTEFVRFTSRSVPGLHCMDSAMISEQDKSTILLYDGGIQFGPYLYLPAGKYNLEVERELVEGDSNFSITADAGQTSIPFEVIEETDNLLKVEFSLPEAYNLVEFVNRHIGVGVTEVKGITLYPIDSNVTR